MKTFNITLTASLLFLYSVIPLEAQSDLPTLTTCLALQVQDPLAYLTFCQNRGKGTDYKWFKEQQRLREEEFKRQQEEIELQMRLRAIEDELRRLRNR